MTRQQRIWLTAGLAGASALLTMLLYVSLRPSTVPVVVVLESIQPFSPITAAQLDVIRVDGSTARRLFPGAYADPNQLAGMVTVRWIRKNEVLLKGDTAISPQTQLTQAVKSKGLTLSYMIPPDYKALTVSASLPSAAPGDFIMLYRKGETQPLFSRPVQVLGNGGSGLLVLLQDEEIQRLMASQSQLLAALVQSPFAEGSGT